jgi:SAM-dependent methyltransferase
MAGFMQAHEAPDGLPFPPANLIETVGRMSRGPRRFLHFWQVGELWVEKITRLLAEQGASVADMDAILDFGCGCGRVIRHWPKGPRLVGSDYNPVLVEWCEQHLPFEFVRNEVAPPLPFPDESFDLVYALSVFTHQPPELQRPWMAELERVAKPEGFIALSVLGSVEAEAKLSGDDLERFRSGELVVFAPNKPGQNECVAFHPHLRDLTDLEPLAYEPSPGPGQQDVALFGR